MRDGLEDCPTRWRRGRREQKAPDPGPLPARRGEGGRYRRALDRSEHATLCGLSVGVWLVEKSCPAGLGRKSPRFRSGLFVGDVGWKDNSGWKPVIWGEKREG